MLKTRSALQQVFFQRRSFTASAIHFKSTTLGSHPKLHAHPFDNNKYAVTYVSSDDLKSSKLDPELIIGWSSDKDKLDPKTFVENNKFSNFLTSVLKENIHKVNDTNLKAMADWQKEGWLHIGDERNPAPWGRINYPEDIIGSVEINAGVIKEGSYQAMPTHRLMTNNGIFQLSEPLTNLVIAEAKKKASNAK